MEQDAPSAATVKRIAANLAAGKKPASEEFSALKSIHERYPGAWTATEHYQRVLISREDRAAPEDFSPIRGLPVRIWIGRAPFS